jgi:hypothetical protein
MDTVTLLSEAKARFNHNSAKVYLKEKYESKLIVAEQEGLWKADHSTLNFLYNAHHVQEEVVLMDTFNNPVKVNALELYKKLMQVYNDVMKEWHDEWQELKGKR